MAPEQIVRLSLTVDLRLKSLSLDVGEGMFVHDIKADMLIKLLLRCRRLLQTD